MDTSKLIFTNADGTLSFGDYTLPEKKKVSDYDYEGAKYKVKTCFELTKLEKNEGFLYESEPGTTVSGMKMSENEIHFNVKAREDVQITLGLEDGAEYDVTVDDEKLGKMKTSLGGKLILSVEIKDMAKGAFVKVVKC